jgi:hypothetical protein
MRTWLWVLGAGLALCAAEPVTVPELGFVPPNDNFDTDGSRAISGWMYGGDASISQNYVRLTPDRAVGGSEAHVARDAHDCAGRGGGVGDGGARSGWRVRVGGRGG